MNYTTDYFIKKFEAIPEDKIVEDTQDDFNGGHCAYGWCKSDINNHDIEDGARTDEGIALNKLLSSIPNMKIYKTALWSPYNGAPARINNGDVEQYQQPTPKQRILAALYDCKAMDKDELITLS